MNQIPEKIDIRTMKEFVIENCPPDSLLRQVILIDDDVIKKDELLGRGMLWFKLWKYERDSR